MKKDELQNMSDNQLKEELLSSRREQFNLRMQKRHGEATRDHLIKNVRLHIAKIKTLQNQRRKAS